MVGGGSENVAVFWYLDGRALDWLGQTGPGRGVQVTEHRGGGGRGQGRGQGRRLVSTLRIARADLRHAGKFTCAPSYAQPDTVTLHVVDGEIDNHYRATHWFIY